MGCKIVNRRFITGGILLLLLISGVVIGVQAWQNYQAAEVIKNGPSNQEVLDTIIRDKPAFLYKGKSIIEVASLKRFDDWYVAIIKSPNDKSFQVPVKIILEDIRTGKEPRNLKVKLGPDTHFTDYEMLQYGMPDSLIQELRK